MGDIKMTIETPNAYTIFSRLKVLADTLTTQAAREALALDMRKVCKLVEDDLDREAMLRIANEVAGSEERLAQQ
jgi:hypothetical protein